MRKNFYAKLILSTAIVLSHPSYAYDLANILTQTESFSTQNNDVYFDMNTTIFEQPADNNGKGDGSGNGHDHSDGKNYGHDHSDGKDYGHDHGDGSDGDDDDDDDGTGGDGTGGDGTGGDGTGGDGTGGDGTGGDGTGDDGTGGDGTGGDGAGGDGTGGGTRSGGGGTRSGGGGTDGSGSGSGDGTGSSGSDGSGTDGSGSSSGSGTGSGSGSGSNGGTASPGVLGTPIGGLSGTPQPVMIDAQVMAYASLPLLTRELAMSELDSLHKRLGELRNNGGWVGHGPVNLGTKLGSQWHNVIQFDDSRVNTWIRLDINRLELESENSFGLVGDYGGINIGIDKKFDLDTRWSMFGGLFSSYKVGRFETANGTSLYMAEDSADIDLSTWSMGAYASFFNHSGTYIDIVGEYMDLTADIKAGDYDATAKGYSISGSAEIGHSFDLAANWIIEPQAQIRLMRVIWDEYNKEDDVSFDGHTYITGRSGLRIEHTAKTTHGEVKPWAYMGVVHEFSEAPHITHADTAYESHDFGTMAEGKLGITVDMNKAVKFYADTGYVSDFSEYGSIKGNIGLRMAW